MKIPSDAHHYPVMQAFVAAFFPDAETSFNLSEQNQNAREEVLNKWYLVPHVNKLGCSLCSCSDGNRRSCVLHTRRRSEFPLYLLDAVLSQNCARDSKGASMHTRPQLLGIAWTMSCLSPGLLLHEPLETRLLRVQPSPQRVVLNSTTSWTPCPRTLQP